MPYTYSDVNRRENIVQPNLTRQRMPYSGPISSEKFNLFNDQFIVDVARLLKNTEDIESKISEAYSFLELDLEAATPGYYINGDIDMTINTQHVYYDQSLEVYVIDENQPYLDDYLQFFKSPLLSSKIHFLVSKLNDLEKNKSTEYLG
jgi:hypothetical protein